MVKTIFQLILVLCILTVQVASAFAVPELPCAQMGSEHMAGMNMTKADTASHAVMMSSMQANDSLSTDCCEHECGCSMGVLSLVMAVNVTSFNDLIRNPLRINNNGFGDINIVLAQPQRPPKH
ncbi:MAG: hypothetical protein ACJAVV_002008 [Alphaproteobacteria bacterium]